MMKTKTLALRRLVLALMALMGVAACESDEEGITGTYNLVVSEREDTCDDELNSFPVRVTIAGGEDDITVTFGDIAVLAGFVDDEGFVQAQDTISVPVVVDGQTVQVESFMQIQLGLGRLGLEGNGRLTYDGTHPSAPGEVCKQEFDTEGERALRAPYLPTGPRG